MVLHASCNTLRQQNFHYPIGQPILPIEIAESIINQPGIDLLLTFTFRAVFDYEMVCLTLRNFALTCRVLRPRSYYYLYGDIKFGSPRRARVVDVLRKNLELRKGVHVLTFYDSFVAVTALRLTGPRELPDIRALSFVGCADMFKHKYFRTALTPFSHTITVLAFHGMSMERRDFLRILCALPNIVAKSHMFEFRSPYFRCVTGQPDRNESQ